jgi:hypothetical protein
MATQQLSQFQAEPVAGGPDLMGLDLLTVQTFSSIRERDPVAFPAELGTDAKAL